MIRCQVSITLHHFDTFPSAHFLQCRQWPPGLNKPAVGPFEAWAPLAESTKADRIRSGYTEGDRLERSGKLKNSIQSEVVGLAAIVGTKSEIGFWQEVGTDRIPPRPFIGPAYIRKIDPLMNAIGLAVTKGFKAY